jgi:NAD(P)-dependent dehydrogenase (short-subunit alcohol dehydrogenase family)
MKHVVVTGSTRGIGLGLAKSFLDLDCSVTISGRVQSDVDQVVKDLNSIHPAEQVVGFACDVRSYDQVQALWDQSISRFNKVDIWINNAGWSGPQLTAWMISPDQAKEIIETNLVGEIYGTMIAIHGMINQGYGAIYNMEGLGSDGRILEGLAYYGTSNAGRNYFNHVLIKEAKDTPVIIGTLHPGMVATDLLTKPYEDRPEDWERAKRIFNILADRVETVTPWMATQILKNEKSGVRISWSSRWKILGRFLTSPFTKRDIFEDPG